MPAGRLAVLGATMELHHGLLTMDAATLRDRLRGIVKPAGPALNPVIFSLSPASLEETLDGVWREAGNGRSFVVTRRLAPHESHGGHRIEQFAADLQRASSAAALLGPASAQAPFVFFDLETTGLSGGAGTYAFLVGCGWFDAEGGFVTEQHLMTEYGAEQKMLHMVAADLGRAGTLVTFNGKSFDAPVIETRYLFHRMSSPCAGRPHVDLLHPARRFWASTNEAGCSLLALEQQVLGVQRVGDVPGFEIPSRYFRFVRTGNPRPLVDVLDHNRLDLLSLAGLTARVFHLVEAGPDEARHPREALALGRVYRSAGLDERAEGAFERALRLSEPDPSMAASSVSLAVRTATSLLRVDALRALALGARRQRRYETAATWWRAALDVPACPDHIAREAIQALAIHHEHRARDLAAAKMFALRGLQMEPGAPWGDAVRHRLARIERKIVSERLSLFPSSTSPPQPSCDSPMSARRTSS